MKKLVIITMAAGFMAISSTSLFAYEPTNSVPSADQPVKKKVDPAKRIEERRKFLASVGLAQADLKGLSPQNRKAKVKAAVDAKISALEQKQSAGSLTTEEQTNLAKLKKFEQHQVAKKNPTS